MIKWYVLQLVDMEQVSKNKNNSKSTNQKTYIDPNLFPFTREFNDKEISEWIKEDQL